MINLFYYYGSGQKFSFPKSIKHMHLVGVCNEYKAKEYKARYHNTPTIPIRGTASLVLGMTEETMFINTVRDRRIVTPETNTSTAATGTKHFA